MSLYNRESSKEIRRNLRKNMTPAEVALWTMLKSRKLNGERFMRQYSIGKYVLDFYCPKHRLAIELDGAPHFEEYNRRKDEERALYIESHEIRVLRFENFEVFQYPQRTLDEILKYLYNGEKPEDLLHL